MPACSITSASLDGRAQNPRYIQKQLRRLHEALLQNAQTLQAAACHDGSVTKQEAALEHALALDTVSRRYLEIDIKSALRNEYRTANGVDWAERAVPKGIVHIQPQRHTMLYSVVAPLSSAIAAGSCVVIELESSLLEIATVIRRTLEQTMDNDTIAIVSTFSDAKVALEDCITVNQAGDESKNTSGIIYTSPGNSMSIALVDRSADTISAAQQIVALRTAFGGSSPYAADVVLVNEFALNDFLRAAAQALTETLGGSQYDPKSRIKTSRSYTRPRAIDLLGKEVMSDPKTETVLEGDKGSLIIVTNRLLVLSRSKMNGPIILVHPIRSLDDGLDLANSFNRPLLVSYHFAAPAAAKYTSQFIESHVSIVNTIPIELRVGPAAPQGFAVSVADRYRPDMFTRPSPQYSEPSRLTQELGNTAASTQSQIAAIQRLGHSPLPDNDQKSGGAIGFFEQGIITGASLLFTPLMGGVVFGVYMGVRAILSRR